MLRTARICRPAGRKTPFLQTLYRLTAFSLLFALLLWGIHCRSSFQYGEFLKTHPGAQSGNWNLSALNLPVEKRAGPAPETALRYARDLNRAEGYSEVPVPADLPEGTKLALIRAIQKLDPLVRKVAADSLIGIYFCRNLGSSALTGFILDENQKAIAGYILFDVDKLSRPANEWVTFRENTAFASEAAGVRYTIAAESENTVAGSYLYLMVHELAHIHSEVNKKTVSLISPPSSETVTGPFFSHSWISYSVSRYDSSIPWRSRVRFYLPEPSLPGNRQKVSDIYEDLDRTNFVSLYAMINPWEDFAETSTYLFLCKDQCRVQADGYTTIDYRKRPGMAEKLKLTKDLWR